MIKRKASIRILRVLGPLFLGILLTISVSYISFSFYPNNGITMNWISFYSQEKNSIDVMIMGNSHAYSTFNTDMLNEQLKKKHYILASNSQNVTQTYYNLMEVLKYQKPKMVILETSAIDYNENWQNGAEAVFDRDWKKESNIDGMRFGLPKILAIINQYNYKNWPYAFFRISRSHQNWKDVNQLISNHNFTSVEVYAYRTFSPSTTVMSEDTKKQYAEAAVSESLYKISDSNMKHFYMLAELCKKENIQLCLVSAPFYDVFIDSINYESEKSSFEKLAAEADCVYLDINDYYDEIGLQAEDFEDFYSNYHHLNHSGADKVTAFMIEWLKGKE